MKKVLISLDYGPTAQKVAETGFSLAKALKADIILLHVIRNLAYYSSSEAGSELGFISMGPWRLLEGDDDLEKGAQKFLDKIKHHLGDEKIQTLLKEGEIAGSVLNAAHELKVDILVMGSHSRKWLENIVMGSITEKVLNSTSVPVFIVPTKKKK